MNGSIPIVHRYARLRLKRCHALKTRHLKLYRLILGFTCIDCVQYRSSGTRISIASIARYLSPIDLIQIDRLDLRF